MGVWCEWLYQAFKLKWCGFESWQGSAFCNPPLWPSPHPYLTLIVLCYGGSIYLYTPALGNQWSTSVSSQRLYSFGHIPCIPQLPDGHLVTPRIQSGDSYRCTIPLLSSGIFIIGCYSLSTWLFLTLPFVIRVITCLHHQSYISVLFISWSCHPFYLYLSILCYRLLQGWVLHAQMGIVSGTY